jgi:hypothetical protein
MDLTHTQSKGAHRTELAQNTEKLEAARNNIPGFRRGVVESFVLRGYYAA